MVGKQLNERLQGVSITPQRRAVDRRRADIRCLRTQQSSNGIARFALDAVTDSRERANDIKLKTGAYGRVEVTRTGVRLLDWNIRPPAETA